MFFVIESLKKNVLVRNSINLHSKSPCIGLGFVKCSNIYNKNLIKLCLLQIYLSQDSVTLAFYIFSKNMILYRTEMGKNIGYARYKKCQLIFLVNCVKQYLSIKSYS